MTEDKEKTVNHVPSKEEEGLKMVLKAHGMNNEQATKTLERLRNLKNKK